MCVLPAPWIPLPGLRVLTILLPCSQHDMHTQAPPAPGRSLQAARCQAPLARTPPEALKHPIGSNYMCIVDIYIYSIYLFVFYI